MILFLVLSGLWFASFLLFVAAVMMNSTENPHPDITFKEWHHGYLGDLLFIVGLWIFNGWVPLLIMGLIFRMDDSYQHFRQLDKPEFHSILHRLYAKYLWPIPFVQAITKWLDRLFGGRS